MFYCTQVEHLYLEYRKRWYSERTVSTGDRAFIEPYEYLPEIVLGLKYAENAEKNPMDAESRWELAKEQFLWDSDPKETNDPF